MNGRLVYGNVSRHRRISVIWVRRGAGGTTSVASSRQVAGGAPLVLGGYPHATEVTRGPSAGQARGPALGMPRRSA